MHQVMTINHFVVLVVIDVKYLACHINCGFSKIISSIDTIDEK